MGKTKADNMQSGILDEITGVWWLVSREDRTFDNQKRIDPTLGETPKGILVYSNGYFAAQFMKEDRSNESMNILSDAGKNNTRAVGGYDAYFGNYKIDSTSGHIAHTLIGSISPENIGITVLRNLVVEEDQLVIKLNTTTLEKEKIVRTLKWRRISSMK